MRFLSWLVTTALAVAAAAWLLDGIVFEGPTTWPDEFTEKLVPLLVVALILGVVSSFVKPILTLLSIPFIIITLGLFLLVINAAMLRLTSWLAGELDIGFTVAGWWPAIGGAIVITLTTWVVDGILGEQR
ncbi:MAG: phage holin family protein [Nocardioides sp.]